MVCVEGCCKVVWLANDAEKVREEVGSVNRVCVLNGCVPGKGRCE